MGATLGNHEFSSQTNHNADCVPADDRWKWVDDLTVLERINLVNMRLRTYNITQHVASDIPTHGQFIDSNDLKTQKYLTEINQWTENQKMSINQNKTNAMLINFTQKQFTTRLFLKGESVELVDKIKILGVTINNQLNWDENTAILVRKVNQRMQLLRAVWSFGSNISEMVHLWKLYCLSVLEQSCVVWGTSITQQNIEDLERTQKCFAKLVLQEKYSDYKSALIQLNLETLSERREKLLEKFATTSIANRKLHEYFNIRKTTHQMKLRDPDFYRTTRARTERFRTSSILSMQRLLNKRKREE